MDKKKSENPNSETSNDMLENLNSDTIYDDDEDFIERIKNKVNKQSWFTDLKICFVVLTRIPIYVGETSNDFSIADSIELTRVHSTFEGDAFFPIIDSKNWKLVKEEKHFSSKDQPHDYSYLKYKKINN